MWDIRAFFLRINKNLNVALFRVIAEIAHSIVSCSAFGYIWHKAVGSFQRYTVNSIVCEVIGDLRIRIGISLDMLIKIRASVPDKMVFYNCLR